MTTKYNRIQSILNASNSLFGGYRTYLLTLSASCDASVNATSHNDEAAGMQDSRLGDIT
jgi:hypothetical protein